MKFFFGFYRGIVNGRVKIILKDNLNLIRQEQDLDLVPIDDLKSADFYGRNPPILGTIKFRLKID